MYRKPSHASGGLRSAFAVVVFLASLTCLPHASALEQQDPCDLVILETQLTFEPYRLSGVPAPILNSQLMKIAQVCGDGGAIDVVQGVVSDIPILTTKDLCSGGGATVAGWEDEVIVAGIPYSALRGPASSHYTFSKTDSGDTVAFGDTRSLLDDIEWSYLWDRGQIVTWQFAGLPMGGIARADGHCLGSLVTSVFVEATGTPLGIPTTLVQVHVSGTTCLVPC